MYTGRHQIVSAAENANEACVRECYPCCVRLDRRCHAGRSPVAAIIGILRHGLDGCNFERQAGAVLAEENGGTREKENCQTLHRRPPYTISTMPERWLRT